MPFTLVGVFDRTEKAEIAADRLAAAGVGADRIALSAAVRADGNLAPESEGQQAASTQGVRAFLSDLLDEEDPHADRYTEAMRLGWTVLRVDVNEVLAGKAASVLAHAGAIDLDGAAGQPDDDRPPVSGPVRVFPR